MGRITTNERSERAPPPRGEDEELSRALPVRRGLFSDRDAWAALEQAVIEPLVAGRTSSEPLRIWVACAGTGEAAYSVALLLVERLEAEGGRCPIQVFATDASGGNLEFARAGRYPENRLRHVAPSRLRFFHDASDSGSRIVVSALREIVFFGKHALHEDAPLHRMDLVCCLDDLQALSAEHRRRALQNLRQAPRAGGHVFFGGPELVADTPSMVTVSRRWGIQRSLGGRTPRAASLAALFDEGARLAWARAAGADSARLAALEPGLRMVDFGDRFGDALLCTDAAALLSGQVPNDRQVQGGDGVTFVRRLSPHPEGVMVTLNHGSGNPYARTFADVIADFERLASVNASQSRLLNDSLHIANRAESFSQALRESLESVCVNLEWPLAHVWLGDGSRDGFGDGGVWYRRPRDAFPRFVRASRRFRFKVGLTSLGVVVERGAPIWVADVTADAALCRSAEEAVEGGLAGALLVPIRQGDTTIGVLEFFTTRARMPSSAIIDGLADFGAQLGVIREREQNQKALRMLASERLLAEQRERNKLAKDLHDDLGQVLALARMGLDGLRAAAPSHGASIDRVSGLLTQANETVRSLSFRLSPPVLRELGLVPALEWLAESLPLPAGMRIEVRSRAGDLGWLSEPDRVILFRSARELVINAIKHSIAKRVSVDLRRSRSFLVISVADDGVGLPSPQVATASGFGLTSVRESLGLLGGRLSLSTRLGGGALAVIQFPIRKEVL